MDTSVQQVGQQFAYYDYSSLLTQLTVLWLSFSSTRAVPEAWTLFITQTFLVRDKIISLLINLIFPEC